MDNLQLNSVCGIYGLRCKTTEKWYVGQSVDIPNRWYAAYERGNCKGQTKIYHALKKYGYADFEKVVLEQTTPDQVVLTERERFWMQELRSLTDGYNIREAGRRGKFSEETRKKMSAAKLNKPGRKWSDEERARRAKNRKPVSPETCAKISAARRGQKLGPMSEAHRANISKSHQNISQEWRDNISAGLVGKKRVPFTETHRKNLGHAIKQGWARRNNLLQVDKTAKPHHPTQLLTDTQLMNNK